MSLLKHQNSKNWYYRFIIEGKIHFGSTKTSNRTLAAKVERAKYEAALSKNELGDKPTITIEKAFETFLKTQEQNGEYRNIKTYINKMLGIKNNSRTHDGTMVKIYGFDGEQEFHELDKTDVQKLILSRRSEGNKDVTILHELIQLSKAIKLIDKLGFMTPNINLKELKQDNKLRPSKIKLRYLTIEEEALLMKQLDPSTAVSKELREERGDMRDLVICLLDTGARYTEIASLKWSDVSLEQMTNSIYRSKTNNQSVLSMTNRLFKTLSDRFAVKRDNQIYVFENSEKTGHRKYAPKAFVDACKRAGIEGITLHSLRRTHASRLVQAGVSLQSVAQLLGHTSSRTTEIHYAHLAPNQASKAAVEVLNKMNGHAS